MNAAGLFIVCVYLHFHDGDYRSRNSCWNNCPIVKELPTNKQTRKQKNEKSKQANHTSSQSEITTAPNLSTNGDPSLH